METLKRISIPEEKTFDGTVFPLSVSPNEQIKTIEESIDFVKNNYDSIRAELKKHGAILFRDFPVQSPKDFNDFAVAFGWLNLPYIGGAAVRHNVYGVVFTSNEAPPDQPIPFHHEMAHVEKFPSYLFFYCDVEPKEGGETPICLSTVAYDRISKERPALVEKLGQKKLKYSRVLPEPDDPSSPIGRGWKSTFQTEDKQIAEQRSVTYGGTFEWLENNNLRTVSKLLPGTRVEEETGKVTWFNSIVPIYYGWRDSRNTPEKAVTFEDDEPMCPEDVAVCARVLEEICVAFKWHKGDVLLIDNKLAMHARRNFVPPRRILAALFQ